MKKLIKNAILHTVYHIAKETVTSIEMQMRKENREDVANNEMRREMLIVSTLHTLLGIIYND